MFFSDMTYKDAVTFIKHIREMAVTPEVADRYVKIFRSGFMSADEIDTVMCEAGAIKSVY